MADVIIEEIKDDNPKKGGNKTKKVVSIIIILIIVLLLVLLGFLGYSYFSKKSGYKQNSISTNVSNQTKVNLPEKSNDNNSTSSNITGMGPIYSFDPFIVNLSDPDGSHYLKMSMDVEADSNVVIQELEQRTPQLRDTVINILSSKTSVELLTIRGKLAVKEEIIRRFNLILKSGKIRNVYLTEFIVQ